MNAEFYSLSNSFLCYIEQKIYLFLWRDAISRFKCPKNSGQHGLIKVRTLKVNVNEE
jgi:hypothetical protein